ncbi:MAG TPA: PIG-L family deacetylase [Bryobacteraceae bacterium]|jgi:LmbE family N-acetylglucosaminyl deacetylase|nr:PIG-L family deacetylase [Bryobacteraceae bacterium]
MGDGDLRALVVVAHPDDEVVGAGIWIHRHIETHGGEMVHVLHITDGSPRDMENARALGFTSRESYAEARRKELAGALRLLGVPASNRTQFNFPDKEAYLHLPDLSDQVHQLISRLRPDVVLSPAYEGGHPDHDSAAFAAALAHERTGTFQHLEFPLYHASRRGRMVTGRFIGGGQDREEVLLFSGAERRLKSETIGCFETQREILSQFRSRHERFRRVLKRDFTRPPHPGPLLYERWGWGINGADWRDRAREALGL